MGRYDAQMFSGVTKKIVDPEANTAKEVAKLLLLSDSHASRICRERVERGEWERVWKQGKDRMVPAYRPKNV